MLTNQVICLGHCFLATAFFGLQSKEKRQLSTDKDPIK